MQIISEAKQYVILVGFVLLVLFALVAIAGIYFVKFYRVKVKEKMIDYDHFERKDAVEFIKMDDIYDNMIVMGNRFIAGIRCIGVDYPYAEEEEKLQIMRGYLSFFNLIDHDTIQFRQTAKSVNLDELIHDYKEKLKKLREEQYIRSLDYEEIKKEAEQLEKHIEDYELYYEKLKQMQREITSYGYQMNQLEAQVQYMESLTGESAEPERDTFYFFDWKYNPLEYTKELKKAEIYQKAERQLRNKASSYISALRHAGIKAHRMSGTELQAEIWRFTHPISANTYNPKTMINSNYHTTFVTSDSINEMEKKVNKNTLKEILEELNI